MTLKLSLKQLQLLESTIDLAIQDEMNNFETSNETIAELNDIHDKVLNYLAFEAQKQQAQKLQHPRGWEVAHV